MDRGGREPREKRLLMQDGPPVEADISTPRREIKDVCKISILKHNHDLQMPVPHNLSIYYGIIKAQET